MALKNQQVQLTIIGGPSKWDLMVSLFEGNPSFLRHTVRFTFVERKNMEVAVTGVE